MGRRRVPRAVKLALIGGAVAGGYVGWQALQRVLVDRRNRRLARGKAIVVLGEGFAGTHVARELARLLPRPDDAQITLVGEVDYLLFTPMLPEVAGGELDGRDIVVPLRTLSSRVTFEEGRVTGVDLEHRRVTIDLGDPGNGIPQTQKTLTADHLVIALGSEANYHHVPGLQEHSLSMKSLEDAAAIRNRVLGLLERADAEHDAATRRRLLTFVVGGGGFTGVETMAALNDLVRESARSFEHVPPESIRTVLVHPGDRLLSELDPKLAGYAQAKLEDRGIEVILDKKITGAGDGWVDMEDGRRIEAQTLIWAAGVRPSTILDKLDCRRGHHGGIAVDACCAVPGHPGVWALGDCAEVPRPDGKGTYAPTAQNATREGTLVAVNVAAALRGEEPKPFVYKPLGEMALVGKRSGVARVLGLRFSGLPAWAAWRMVYLAKMPSLRRRVRVALGWALDGIFGRDVMELPSRRPQWPREEPAPAEPRAPAAGRQTQTAHQGPGVRPSP